MNTKKRKGFTLTEIVTVVAIIGMIAAIAVPSYQRSIRQTREGALRSNLAIVRAALAAAFADTGTYPATLDELARATPISTTGYMATGVTRTMDTTLWRGPYLQTLPVDPVSSLALLYYPAGGSGFTAGTVKPSATGNDQSGVAYSTY